MGGGKPGNHTAPDRDVTTAVNVKVDAEGMANGGAKNIQCCIKSVCGKVFIALSVFTIYQM